MRGRFVDAAGCEEMGRAWSSVEMEVKVKIPDAVAELAKAWACALRSTLKRF